MLDTLAVGTARVLIEAAQCTDRNVASRISSEPFGVTTYLADRAAPRTISNRDSRRSLLVWGVFAYRPCP